MFLKDVFYIPTLSQLANGKGDFWDIFCILQILLLQSNINLGVKAQKFNENPMLVLFAVSKISPVSTL